MKNGEKQAEMNSLDEKAINEMVMQQFYKALEDIAAGKLENTLNSLSETLRLPKHAPLVLMALGFYAGYGAGMETVETLLTYKKPE